MNHQRNENVALKITFAWSLAAALLLAGCQTAPVDRQMRIGDATLPYRAQGSGTPVVLVHGCCLDQRSWAPHVKVIADKYLVFTFDQRYWGPTPWADQGEKFSGETQIEDLAAFLRGLGIGPVHLVGWSMSGVSVLGVALRYPELVRSLYLYEPSVASTITDPAELKLAGDNRAALFGPVLQSLEAGDHAMALRRMMDNIDGQPGAYDALPAAFRAIQLDNARALPIMFAAPPPPRISCEQLGQIKVPAAIARGARTRPFYRIAADAAGRCLRGAKSVVVPGAGHLWPAQEPQAFAAALRNWLSER